MTKLKNNFPCSAYESSWKLFRRLSDENKVTAEMILSRPSWPRHEGIKIADIGCGDGLLIRELCENSAQGITSVSIIDPYVEWLNEAENNLSDLTSANVVGKVERVQGKISHFGADLFKGHDALLLVHVVYLMEKEEFQGFLRSLPKGVPAFLVMDDPSSVFSRIWQVTQPKYFAQVEDAHFAIANLSNDYSVSATTITSRIDDPSLLSDAARSAILSILSYTDYASLSSEEVKYVDQQVAASTVRGKLICDSVCYEIKRGR